MVWLWSGSARLALHVRDGVRVDGSVLPPLPVANTLTCANSSGRHIQDALAVVYQTVRDVFADADSAGHRPQPVREPPAGDEQLLVAEPSEIKPMAREHPLMPHPAGWSGSVVSPSRSLCLELPR